MKLKTFFFAVLSLTLCDEALSQGQPTYPERFFDNKPQIATEGVIAPEEYKVGPGDKLFISISGVTEFVNTYIIDQEGWIYIPRIGGINLTNSSLADSKTRITEAILKYYKNVDIFISLVDFRLNKVSLIGNVNKPSVITVTANSRLMDLISSSAQLTATSDLRNIKIISKTGETNSYDLLRFMRFGDFSHNPFLLEGDVIRVDRADQVVQISGEVNYPAMYEFRSGETILDLLELAGGFNFYAKKDTLELIRFLEDGKTQISIYYPYEELKLSPVYLQNKDHLVIRKIPEYLIDHYVVINGYVKYPGWYKIQKNITTLKDIIEEAGGFLEEASLTDASIIRKMDVEDVDNEYERLKLIPTENMTEDEYDYFKAKSRQRSGPVIVDFLKLFIENNLSENIILRKNDVITIPEKKDYIIMLGQLVNPGKIIYDSTLNVSDYISLAGGFGWRALEGDVRVIRAKTGEWVEADEVEFLKPGDTIWVPEDPPGPKFWEVFTDVLAVVAQVAAILAASAAVIIATR